MMTETLPPGLLLIGAAAVLAFTRGRVQLAVLVAAPLLALWNLLMLGEAATFDVRFLQYEVALLGAGELGRAFAVVLLLCTLALGVHGWGRASTAELVLGYAIAGLATGVALAGDLVAVWLQWELAALAGAALIWQGRSEEARAAGFRFLVMQLIGGIAFKFGMEGAYADGGYALRVFDPSAPLIWGLVVGVLIKAAAFPLAAWLPDAYTRATPMGTAFLAMLLPATGLLMLLVLLPGATVLVWVGALTLVYALVYGLKADRLLTMLCYLAVLLGGAVMVGAGLGGEEAVAAAVSLLLAKVPALLLLFVFATSLVRAAGDDSLRAVGRWSASEPMLALLALVAGLVLCALPFTAGFAGWAGLLDASAAAGRGWLVILLAVALIGAFVIAVTRFSGAVQPAGSAPGGLEQELDATVYVAGVVLALTALGVTPWLIQGVPEALAQVETVGRWLLVAPLLLAVAVVASMLLGERLGRTAPMRADVDWLWRVGLFRAGRALLEAVAGTRDMLERRVLDRLGEGRSRLRRMAGADGVMGRDWSTGVTSLWVAVLLVAYLIIYYFW